MNANTLTLAPVAPPPPLAGQAVTRLKHLFRASLRDDKIHPLLRVMQLHRGEGAGLAAYEPPVPSALQAAPTPRSLEPEQVRRRVAELPHLPKVALRALQTLRRDDASLDDVAKELGCDASLTARVLRLANSPFYGVPGRVCTARDAAQILGRRTLESVLTLAAVSGQFAGAHSQAFQAPAFWRHALATAIAARVLARTTGCDEDQAFAAGLLHDIGLLAMSVYFPGELDALIHAAIQRDMDLSTVERLHGLTPHALVGSWIAAHWNFPAAVVQAIGSHHAPKAGGAAPKGIASCVHVANAIAHALDVANLEHELVPALDLDVWAALAPDDDALLRLFDDVEAGVRSLCAALVL